MEDQRADGLSSISIETRDYVLKHWTFHADQRLRTFHFFILVASVLLTGMFAYLKDAAHPAYLAPAGFLLALLCYIFWRLDCRNRVFIHHAEDILIGLEESIPIDLIKKEWQLFSGEKAATAKSWELYWNNFPKNILMPPLSLYHAFGFIFAIFAILGVGVGIIALVLPGH